MLLLLLFSSLFLAYSSCPDSSLIKSCDDVAEKCNGVCNNMNGCIKYTCTNGCGSGSTGCSTDPITLPPCPKVASCDKNSCSCSGTSTCGKYTCSTCSGTGIYGGADCSSNGNLIFDCNSGIWSNFTNCYAVEQKCGSKNCISGAGNYGKYSCFTSGCSGWFCPNPPCTQNLECPPVTLDSHEPNLCISLNSLCNSSKLGDLIYSDVTLDGGFYQCFRCSGTNTVKVRDSSYREDSNAIDSGMAVLYFIIGFIVGSAAIYIAAYYMNKHYNPPIKTPTQSWKEKIKSTKETISSEIKNYCFKTKAKSESFTYHFLNNHELFSMTCLSDPLEHNRILNIRQNLNKLIINIALSLVFCGIDVSNSVKTNTCKFDGRNGFTSSATTYETNNLSTITLPTVSYKVTLLVFFLKNILILPSIGFLKGKVFTNMKQADKNKRFMLLVFSLIIEIVWIIIFVSCYEAEQNITSTAEVPDKISLYIKTVAIVAAMDWIGWNNIIIVISYFLNKYYGNKNKYEPAAITSPAATEPKAVV